MKTNIICFHNECYEIPTIRLIYSSNNYKINADCIFHHYEYKLEEYLRLLIEQKKIYRSTCPKHNKKYVGFVEDISINVCEECILNEDYAKITFFKDFKISETNKKDFKYNNLLSNLYDFIYNDYFSAKKCNQLVAGLYLNLKYMNNYIDSNSNGIDDKILTKYINVDISKTIENIRSYPFKINSKYWIRSLGKRKIQVWIIEKNEFIIGLDDSYDNLQIGLSPFYYQIFLTVSYNEIRIWEISEEKKEIILKTIIYLPNPESEKFVFAKFSPLNEKNIFSVSNDYSIKIWNLEKIFCIEEIKFFTKPIENIVFHPWNELIIGIETKEDVHIYNIKKKVAIYSIKAEQIIYFTFLDSERIIFVDEDIIKIINYITNIEEKNFDNKNANIYYYENDLLYLFDKNLTIIDLGKEKDNIIENVGNLEFNKSNIVLLIKERNDILSNIFFNFAVIKSGKIFFYSLISNYYNRKNNKKQLKKITKYFFDNNSVRLYSKFELSFDNIIPEEDEIFKKKYLENDIIFKQMLENYHLSLEQKKINVEKEINHYEEKSPIENEYFHLISLLIQDNTNKMLIKKYLLFLYNNDKNLKIEKIETYEDEFNYYKVLFTPQEIEEYFHEKKDCCEKEEFLKLIKKLYLFKKDEYDKFKSNIDKSKLGRFNQKIDFKENNELYWFRNSNLIIYQITKITYENFGPIKYCIKQVIKRNLLEDSNIIQNRTKLTCLVINLLTPQNTYTYDYNLNLLSSCDIKPEEFKKKLIQKQFIEINGEFYLHNHKKEEKGLKPEKDFDICIDNYILNNKKNKNYKKHEVLNFDKIIDNFHPKIDINRIKKFLSKFLVSNLFKEIYAILYPDNLIFPFPTIKSSEKFINENFNFVPIRNESSHGSTDKFTLESYIYLAKKKFFNIPSNFDENKDSILLEGLITGELVKTGIHEINHDMYNIYFYHSNGTISLKTPRKNHNNLRESGIEIETLLFGSRIRVINLKQILYLLNENNLNKGVIEFKNGFKFLKDEDLDVQGEFNYLNNIKNSPYFNVSHDFSISTEDFRDLLSIESKIYDDAI